jgi:hypothetical protein
LLALVFGLPGFDAGAQFVAAALRFDAAHAEPDKQPFNTDTEDETKQYDDDDPNEH